MERIHILCLCSWVFARQQSWSRDSRALKRSVTAPSDSSRGVIWFCVFIQFLVQFLFQCFYINLYRRRGKQLHLVPAIKCDAGLVEDTEEYCFDKTLHSFLLTKTHYKCAYMNVYCSCAPTKPLRCLRVRLILDVSFNPNVCVLLATVTQ